MPFGVVTPSFVRVFRVNLSFTLGRQVPNLVHATLGIRKLESMPLRDSDSEGRMECRQLCRCVVKERLTQSEQLNVEIGTPADFTFRTLAALTIKRT